MGTLPMTMSLVASFMSAITLLGTPAEMYVFGTQYCALVLSYPFVMGAAAHLYLPVFFKLQVSTSYEVSGYGLILCATLRKHAQSKVGPGRVRNQCPDPTSTI